MRLTKTQLRKLVLQNCDAHDLAIVVNEAIPLFRARLKRKGKHAQLKFIEQHLGLSWAKRYFKGE